MTCHVNTPPKLKKDLQWEVVSFSALSERERGKKNNKNDDNDDVSVESTTVHHEPSRQNELIVCQILK